MLRHQLGDADMQFAEIIWDNEPLSSGDLVKLCESKMGWKKSTVYTVLKKLCQRGIFQNVDSIVSSVLSKEEFAGLRSQEFVEDAFGGSLPQFLTAFMNKSKLDKTQIEEIKKMIEAYEGGEE